MTKVKQESTTGECMGIEFFIDYRWRFCVPELDKDFESYGQMRTAIENAEKKVKAARKAKISLAVLTDQGKPATIVGVHAGHGCPISKPAVEWGWPDHKSYPDVAWIREVFARLEANRKEHSQLESSIAPFAFKAKSGSYGSKQFDGTAEGLEKLFAKKLKAAEATTFPAEFAKAGKRKSDIEFDD